jgi:hypothetical protein
MFIIITVPTSLSMEHLLTEGPSCQEESEKLSSENPSEFPVEVQTDAEKTCACERSEACDTETRNYNLNVRLPCSNGQAYSVSQNKVLFLPPCKESDCQSSVKSRVNELESQNGGLVSKPSSEMPDTTGLVLNLASQFEGSKDSVVAGDQEEQLTPAPALTKMPPPQLQAKLLKKEIWDPAEHKNPLTEPSMVSIPLVSQPATPASKPKPDDPFSAQVDRVRYFCFKFLRQCFNCSVYLLT